MDSPAPLILLTSANGKQSRHIIPVLMEQGFRLRLFLHSQGSANELLTAFPKLTPGNFVIGDFLKRHTVDEAMNGVNTVIHIVPPMHPQEAACGTVVIDAARCHNVGHFILSSVLHPLRQKMVHHKVKLEIEEYLIESGIPWTILQPTHFMQNVTLEPVLSSGALGLSYSPATIQGFIDLNDFAQVVLKVVQNPKVHNMARYELLGCVGSYNEVAEIIGRKSGKPVIVERIAMEQAATHFSSHPYTQEAFKRMLYYYDTWGLTGSPNIEVAIGQRAFHLGGIS